MTNYNGPFTRTQSLTVGGVDVTDAVKHAGESGVEIELTATAAIAATKNIIDLNHATVVIAATIADMADHAGGLVIITDTSATGTAAHTVTLTSGTFDGTNNVATLNALGESLVVHVLADGNGRVVTNTGSVALSAV